MTLEEVLSEMDKEVDQRKGHQETYNLLVPGFPFGINVQVQVPQDDGVPTWEAVQRLLHVW